MRLNQIRATLIAIRGKLTIRAVGLGGGSTRVENFTAALEAATHVRAAGILQDVCDRIIAEPFTLAVNDVIVVDQSTYNAFNSALNELRQKSSQLADVLELVLQPQSSESMSFKLPDSSDLSDVGQTLAQMDKMLQQLVLHPSIGGSVRLENFDRGSLWVDIFLGTSAALTVLLSLVKLYYKAKDLSVVHKTKLAVFDDVKGAVDLRNTFRDALEKQVKEQEESHVQSLLEKFGLGDDHEYRGRFTFAKKELFALLDKGLEIHPALLDSTPPDVVLIPGTKGLLNWSPPPLESGSTEPDPSEPEDGAASKGD